MDPVGDDYRYVIGVIQFLDGAFGVRFFITSRDFDVLFRWWEKGIPLRLVQEALAQVVERRRSRGKPIEGFSVFAHEVRKRYQAFLSLQEQSVRRQEETGDGLDAVREFLAAPPPELQPIWPQLEAYFVDLLAGKPVDSAPVQESLLECFRDEGELAAKCDSFMLQLAPQLRKPRLASTFRLNYLIRRFRIPFP